MLNSQFLINSVEETIANSITVAALPQMVKRAQHANMDMSRELARLIASRPVRIWEKLGLILARCDIAYFMTVL